MASTSSSGAPQMGVSWVPKMRDHLITWSADVKLYRVVEKSLEEFPFPPPANVGFRISDNQIAEVQRVLPEPPHYIKCVEVHPQGPVGRDSQLDIQLAVGLANGRVALRSFASSASSSAAKELSPRSLRPCCGLAWSPLSPHNLLAAGFDRARGDGAVLVFDAEGAATRGTVLNTNVQARFFGTSTREETGEFVRALHELASGEACNSLQWFRTESPMELVAGINGKNLRIFDLRAPDKKQQQGPTTHVTRAVYGVCVDPKLDHRVASYYDNQIMFWDTRSFDKPILTQEQHLKVTKIEWCPNRQGLLCSAAENSSNLTIHDIQAWSHTASIGEPAMTERRVTGWSLPPTAMEALAETEDVTAGASREVAGRARAAGGGGGGGEGGKGGKRSKHPTGQQSDEEHSPFSAFSWHPSDETSIMAVAKSGRLSAVEVTERISPSWSSEHCLMWPHNGKLTSFSPEVTQLFNEITDISVIMQERVGKGYGSLDPLWENSAVVSGYHPSCATAWNWLHHCGKLMKDDLSFRNAFSKSVIFPGVRTALARIGVVSDITYNNWNVKDSSGLRPKKMFSSVPRQLAQRLCGWGIFLPEDLAAFSDACARRGEHTRAAAVSAFCLEMGGALTALQRGARAAEEAGDAEGAANLTFVRMALAGFTEQKEGEWRDTARQSLDNMADPYSRALFSFLTASEGDHTYAAVLDEPGIYMTDKIAFAAQYLSDERLAALVNIYWREYRDKGDLVGLILSGMENEALELLQRYLDLTGDVQTVSWLSVRCMRPDLAKLPKPQEWFSCYSALLDSWRLWIHRADFDIAVGRACMFKSPPLQVYISCAYCGAAVTTNLQGIPGTEDIRVNNLREESKAKSAKQTGTPSARMPPTVCPSCKKPLPRCAICLMMIGTDSGRRLTVEPPTVDAPLLTSFDNFPAWCQQCRHGGHAGHIDAWFELNRECPVPKCSCRCMDHDLEDNALFSTPVSAIQSMQLDQVGGPSRQNKS